MVDRKQRIIEVALDIFRRKGFHAVGIDEIISTSGVAKMTLYKHFGSKDNLIAEVLKERERVCFDLLDQRLVAIGSTKLKLEELFRWYGRFMRERCDWCDIFSMALVEFHSDPGEIFSAASRYKAMMWCRLRNILLDRYGEAEASELAFVILMLIEGAGMLSLGLGRKDAFDIAQGYALALLS